MALHTLGTTSATALNAVTFNAAQPVDAPAAASTLSPADLAAIAQGIVTDTYAQATNAGGVKTTGNTNGNTTVAGMASTTRIRAGMLALGAGIVPGTFVVSVNAGASSIVLSQAAISSVTGLRLLFVPANTGQLGQFNFDGQLYIPQRGVLKVLPGDVVAVDNSGWPILISAASIALPGSLWSFV